MESTYRTILLTRDQVAIVDASDFDWLNQWRWHALWSKTANSFYACRALPKEGGKQRIEMMHRLILGLPHGDKRRGDHKEAGNTLDNRRSNLRIASQTQNCRNARLRRTSTSRLKGVSWHKLHNKWKASIRVDKRLKHLGYFATAEAAHDAYKAAAVLYFGEFANVG